MEIFLLLGILLLLVFIIWQLQQKTPNNQHLERKVLDLEVTLQRIEASIKEDFRLNRSEISTVARENRNELNDTLNRFKTEFWDFLKTLIHQNETTLGQLNTHLSQNLKEISHSQQQKLTDLIAKSEADAATMRQTLMDSFQLFGQNTNRKMEDLLQLQQEKFSQLEKRQTDLVQRTESRLEDIRYTQQQKLTDLIAKIEADAATMRQTLMDSFQLFGQNTNQKMEELVRLQQEKFSQLEKQQTDLVQRTESRLEDIRHTVGEKLEKTLSDRLGQSFETVGKQLIEVQRGLGEMQSIASDVGGLKKVLSNVKLRGGIGEVQLAMILEQILAPTQYAANVKTKKGSNDPVEFAIKLPGATDDPNSFVFLPIDAKFPKDIYEHLLAAYDKGHPAEIDMAVKNLETTMRKMARDISEKYIDVPHTTDFAILFLPFEGIYAEVIRRTALVDQLRQDYKITVAGPTTLVAILNSLQMGFRTLALQKRSSEVWKVLGSVKQEFEKFGGLLEKAQKNFQTGMGQLEEVVGRRTKALQRQLRDVESLPAAEANNIDLLPDPLDTESLDDI